jgi:hypothetical protein
MFSNCAGDDVMSKTSSEIINDAIFNLETYGRHHCGKIQINHDRACERLLRESVAVLEHAGMIEWDNVPKWADCDVRIINRPIEKTDFTGDL